MQVSDTRVTAYRGTSSLTQKKKDDEQKKVIALSILERKSG